MNRKDAVRLVSRALSILFGVSALIETAYLPERLYSFVFYANRVKSPSATVGEIHLYGTDRVEVGFLFLRIAIYLLLAMVFWKCAPRVESLLISEGEQ
jgi:hypothetical protein